MLWSRSRSKYGMLSALLLLQRPETMWVERGRLEQLGLEREWHSAAGRMTKKDAR